MCHVSSFIRRSAQSTVVVVACLAVLAACTDGGKSGKETGKNAEGKIPVVASYVIDGGTDTPQNVRVAIHGVRRIKDATVLDWSVTPLAGGSLKSGDPVGQKIDIDVEPGLDNSQAVNLIDASAHKVYRPLDNEDRKNAGIPLAGCLCVPWFMVENDLTIGKTRLLQAAFPDLPASLKSIGVSIRSQPLVTDVPIAAEGKVSTGDSEDLAAPAKELPTASEPMSFRYPMADELDDPAQKMTLVINEVLASREATSLVFTVNAEEDGEGLDAWQGRPVDDPDVVPFGTQLWDLSTVGPGLRPSGASDGKVTRAWFAEVSQKTGIPPGVAKDFTWRECLCSTTQRYAEPLKKAGGSHTFSMSLPALPDGTDSVDVVFPRKTLPPITDVKVTNAKAVKDSGTTLAKVGTWKYGTVADSSLPKGWSIEEWPTPVPSSEDISGSDTAVDTLEDVFSDDVSVERKDSRRVEVTLDSTVSFEPDSARLTSAAKSTIKRIAGDINKSATSGSTLTIEGHVAGTDKGSVTVQKKLSTDRAKAVAAALKSVVTVKVKFSAVGKGATEPAAPNDSEEHRKLNRRVVVAYER